MKKFSYIISGIFGFLFGIGFVALIFEIFLLFRIRLYDFSNTIVIAIFAAGAVLCAITFASLTPWFKKIINKITKSIETFLINIPITSLVFGIIGLIVGMILAALLNTLYANLPWKSIQIFLSVITYLLLGYLGIVVTVKRRNEITGAFWARKLDKPEKSKHKYSNAKILDTSVVIDGRIFDLCRTGFIEGTIVISDLILNELRHIADSSDPTKRVRGRRGLDILKKMQEELKQPVVVVNTKYNDLNEVDEKLVRLTKDFKGKILTNDYNLNKMAQVQNIGVLNINQLAETIKPVILSGEKLHVDIIKEGREHNQGVAFLDDGTMIVVDNAKKCVGDDVEIEITSILQTASGKMIFAKLIET